MKSIQNKETEIRKDEERKCLYSDLILNIVLKQAKTNAQGQAVWFDYTDMENRQAIAKAIKESNGTIELEDAHFNYLKKLVEITKWPMWDSPDILKFKEDITSIK